MQSDPPFAVRLSLFAKLHAATAFKSYVPPLKGLQVDRGAYPALKRWAIMFRPAKRDSIVAFRSVLADHCRYKIGANQPI